LNGDVSELCPHLVKLNPPRAARKFQNLIPHNKKSKLLLIGVIWSHLSFVDSTMHKTEGLISGVKGILRFFHPLYKIKVVREESINSEL